MRQEWKFKNKDEFVEKLQELVDSGVPANHLTTVTPFHVHEVDHILHLKPSLLKFFTLFGALFGLLFGFWFTIYTVHDWPLLIGGKPLVSIPAFIVIAFELTILIGAIVSFKGFLFLAKLPSLKKIMNPIEHENYFIIIQDEGAGSL